MKRQLVSAEEAVMQKRQHTQPCGDCPFARAALPGWLGTMSAEEWIQAAHGTALADCHCTTNQQCAGIAIYRANVCKLPDRPSIKLAPDRVKVFSTPMEFKTHHASKPKFWKAKP